MPEVHPPPHAACRPLTSPSQRVALLLLHLDHNTLYYFNLELLNHVGYGNIISSVGILADFSPPDPGLIVNASRNEVVHEPCVQFTPDEWERQCVEDTPLGSLKVMS